ncbi:unnamed protein product [Miscanthus lutarioriparius]|uniref:Uncharacterized protein n=1 Tax=Miscanthus lutarioriparius TaxID=422564 RepID=A0A811QAS4_9POAL|nr:unnamed protein product [Miscanthus lutarioriparius]
MAAADAMAGATTDNGGAVTMVKMAEMPVEFLRWVLSQDKEDYRVPTLEDYTKEELAEAKDTICSVIRSLQIAYDEFDEFRAWVRDVIDNNGCVMIHEDMLFSDPKEWQESVDQEWAEARQELEMELTRPLGPHLYMLSAYLSLLYHYAAPILTF